MKIAVIGAGISGLVAARLLGREHQVVLFEATGRIGGHARALDLEVGDQTLSLNVGPLLINQAISPHLSALLDELQVPLREVTLHLSTSMPQAGVSYSSDSWWGRWGHGKGLVHPASYRLHRDMRRLSRVAEVDSKSRRATVGELLDGKRLSREFANVYLASIASAIWDSRNGDYQQAPVECILDWLAIHGLRPSSQGRSIKVIDGSVDLYLERLSGTATYTTRLSCPVTSVHRSKSFVRVRCANGYAQKFDCVFLATHADRALNLLADASRDERETLLAFPYQRHDMVVHGDGDHRYAHDSCPIVFHVEMDGGGNLNSSLTYCLSKLQSLGEIRQPVYLTINDITGIDPSRIHVRLQYQRPAMNRDSLQARKRHARICGVYRTYYCGSYWGNGTHEDAIASAEAAVAMLA